MGKSCFFLLFVCERHFLVVVFFVFVSGVLFGSSTSPGSCWLTRFEFRESAPVLRTFFPTPFLCHPAVAQTKIEPGSEEDSFRPSVSAPDPAGRAWLTLS